MGSISQSDWRDSLGIRQVDRCAGYGVGSAMTKAIKSMRAHILHPPPIKLSAPGPALGREPPALIKAPAPAAE